MSSNRVCFGPFEADLRTHELWKEGVPRKIARQPFEILAILLAHPGELVSREDFRNRLWPQDTFVDFEHGLNAAVKKLREALNDSADNPQYIQTLPRLGYRFTATVSYAREAENTPAVEPALPVRPWRKPAAITGLLLLFAALAFLTSSHTTSVVDSLQPVPLTTYPGVELAPSFSPDGNEVAFEWHRDDSPNEADLYVKQVGQERALRLTEHHAKFIEPAWSPDGKSIAFVMFDNSGVGVYVIPALGGRERRLAYLGDGYPWSLVSWSPDSRWVAFAKFDSQTHFFRIHTVNVDTAEERVLPAPSNDCNLLLSPSFAHDGRRLASNCMLTGGGHRIYVQPVDGTTNDITLAATLKDPPEAIAWTEGDRSLVYSGGASLWRVDAHGGTPTKLSNVFAAMGPTISQSGKKLAYVFCHSSNADVWSAYLSADGPRNDKLISSSRGQRNPRFSPDGKHVVFESDRSGSWEIWAADRDGSNPIQLSFFAASSGTPRWAPDSRRVVFDSVVSGHSELYVVSTDGGLPQKLQTGTPNASNPFWSADGNWIYFTTDRPYSIWKVPSSGGKATQFTKEGRLYPQQSPRGDRIFYVVRATSFEIWSIPVNGGDEKREFVLPQGVPDTFWTPSDSGIYFVQGSSTHYSANFYDFATKAVRKITDLTDLAELQFGISVSPDERQLLYSGVYRSETDLMLVDNFH